MSSQEQYKRERDQLQMFLSEIGDYLAKHSGFVQRKSELGGSDLVQMMTLGSLENGKNSLKGFSQVAADLGVKISASGIHQRLGNEAVDLLSQVCQLWLQQKSPTKLKTSLSAFGAVHIIDSSLIILHPSLANKFRGTRSAASMKIQLSYEYRSGQIEALEVREGCDPDQKSQLPQELSVAGDLVIVDLGYFTQDRFAQLDAADVYFLSRLQSQVGLYESAESNQSIDILECVKKLPEQINAGERIMYLGRKAKVQVRVVYYRVPRKIAEERRRKAKKAAKERQKSCSQRSLDLLDWAFFITNAPDIFLNLEQVAEVYRVRWQIEIIFKVWKSEMDWDFIGKWRVERILAQFYGRCLALLVFHNLVGKYQDAEDWEISWQQAYRVLKRQVNRLITIVRRDFWGILTFLRDLDRDFRRFARKSKRRKDPSTFDRLKLVRA